MRLNSTCDVVERLAEQAEMVCRHYLGAGHREGRYWIVGDVRNAKGRSMFVRLEPGASGRSAGKWQDAATGEHGDLLDIIRESCRLTSFRDVLDEAARFLAVPSGDLFSGTKKTERDHSPAARLFAGALPIASTLAEQYLLGRGIIHCGALSALRFHPACYYRSEDGTTPALPALIAAVTDFDGRLTGVHRTYLDPMGFSEATLGKAAVITPKKAMGDLLGNAVRFGRPDDVLAAGEGLETVLSLRSLAPTLPHVAALSAGHLAALILPSDLRRLYLIRDNDAGGRWATARLSERAKAAGIEPIILSPLGNDLNEDLRRNGSIRLLANIRDQFMDQDRSRLLPSTSLRA